MVVGSISGGATNGRTWSAYFDSLFNGRISNYTQNHIANWTVGEPIAPYPDFVASTVILIMTVIVGTGANFSVKFNAFFAGFNICILVFCCIVGFIYGNVENWTNASTGGYFPYGWSGIVKGAASCFWAFTGFEILATSVEEAKNPKRSIPLAIGLAMTITTVLYITTAASLTYMVSYQDLDVDAPLPSAFSESGLTWARYIVSVGPLCGLTTALFSSQYAFVRIAYAMSQDGLLFPVCRSVNGCTRTPVWTTLCGGLIMAAIACFIDVGHIIDFGIIVSLVQYALVSACVIVLRYRPDKSKTVKPAAALPSDEDLNAPKNLPSPYAWKMEKFRETALTANGTSDSMNNLLDNDAERDDSAGGQTPNGGSVTSDNNLEHWESVSQASVDCHEELLQLDSQAGTFKPAFLWLAKYMWCFSEYPGTCVLLAVVLISGGVTLMSIIIVYGEDVMSEASGWWLSTLLLVLAAVTSALLFVVYAHRQSIYPMTLKVLYWICCGCQFSVCMYMYVTSCFVYSWYGAL